MRKSISLIAAAAVAALATLGGAPAGAYHTTTCTAPGTTLPANSAAVGDVDNRQIDSYRIVVPAGQVGALHLQMINGDIDLQVCRVGQAVGQHVCSSENIIGIFDGCHLYDASIIDPDDPFIGWGKPLDPGTYRVSAKHCFSSEDDPDGFCDYADKDLATGDVTIAPGAHDDAPPVNYVIAFVTA